jgi:hypothetical protein
VVVAVFKIGFCPFSCMLVGVVSSVPLCVCQIRFAYRLKAMEFVSFCFCSQMINLKHIMKEISDSPYINLYISSI